jgi:hypothetical protein
LTDEQQQRLDDTATELCEYVDSVKIIKEYFDAIPEKRGIASPYLNFRDALFHFNKMYEAANEDDNFKFIQQYACIQEHLNRGLKDFAIHLCNNFYIIIIHKMINSSAKSKNGDVLSALREIYHSIKNLVIEIRLEGQTLKHFDDNENRWLRKLVDSIEIFNDLLNVNPQLSQLYNNLGAE